jgi:nicotinate phosphoribosyltransferase
MFNEIAEKFSLDFFRHLDIVASNDLNEEVIHQLNKQGHSITLFGIGTNLVTCQAQPALGCVYKLVELNGIPRIKLSNDIVKVLIPGEKKIFRFFDGNGTPQMDLMMAHDENAPQVGTTVSYVNPFGNGSADEIIPHEVEEMLHVVWDRHGSVDIPSLDESRKTCLDGIKKFPSSLFSVVQNAEPYPVNVSLKLYDELQSLWQSSLQH